MSAVMARSAHMSNEMIHLGSADRLFGPTEIDSLNRDLPVMAEILAWVRNFLAKPHKDVGRPGPVCPFVPYALQLNTVWMKVIRTQNPTTADMEAVVQQYRDIFLELEPTDEKNKVNKTILLIFPDVSLEDAPYLIDGVKQKLKTYFVDAGMMIGEFHNLNPSPGLHNPDFRPLRSPIPMLAMRFMVESDLPFLMKAIDSAAERVIFLRAYMDAFGSTLDERRLKVASEALAAALQQKAEDVSESSGVE